MDLDELSKTTLKNYIGKASTDRSKLNHIKRVDGARTLFDPDVSQTERKIKTRQTGQHMALKKIEKKEKYESVNLKLDHAALHAAAQKKYQKAMQSGNTAMMAHYGKKMKFHKSKMNLIRESEELDEVSAAAIGHNDERVYATQHNTVKTVSPSTAKPNKYIVKNRNTGKIHSIHANAVDAVKVRNKIGNAESHAIIKEDTMAELSESEINELSNDTKKKYTSAAIKDYEKISDTVKTKHANGERDTPAFKKLANKMTSRYQGIRRANESEELSELSKKSLEKYREKSQIDHDRIDDTPASGWQKAIKDRIMKNRKDGMKRADAKLSESVSQLYDFIDACETGKSQDISNIFNELVSSRVIEALDDYKSFVAQNLFGEQVQESFEIYDLTEDEINEGREGNLKGLTKHLLKTVTAGSYSKKGAGENSKVETSGRISSASTHRSAVKAALDAGHIPVVHVNGKPHKAAIYADGSGSRPEYKTHSPDKKDEHEVVEYDRPRWAHGKTYERRYMQDRKSKGDAISQLTPSHEKEFYKNNHVEVKTVHPDLVRAKKQARRKAKRPEMQSNYVKAKPGEKEYYNGKIKTSETPAGNMDSIKNAAAEKLARQKLAGKTNSANKEAQDLHAELGKHIAAGNHREAINTAHKLADHVHQKGLASSEDKIREYADHLKSLKGYSKDYAKRRMADMRNESVEFDEHVELMEALAELLDVMEAKDSRPAGKEKQNFHSAKNKADYEEESEDKALAKFKARDKKIEKTNEK